MKRIGKVIMGTGICIGLFCAGSLAVYGEEVSSATKENIILLETVVEDEIISEEVLPEDVVIPETTIFLEDTGVTENVTASDDIVLPEEILIENDMPETVTENEIVTAPEMDECKENISEAERIQRAIDTETEVTITIHEDIVLDSTIYIPSGKKAAFVPAEGKEVTMFRGDHLCGTFFYVEEGATLILGMEGLENSMLVLDNGNHPADDLFAGDGEILLLDGVCMENVETTEEAVLVSAASETEMTGEMAETLTASASSEVVIEDCEIPGFTVVDLKDAAIEIVTMESLIYNGEEHKPDVMVWVGSQMLMKGFDYDVTYANNVNAGFAEIRITATGLGTCTGSASTVFEILPATPEYSVSNQTVESGMMIADLVVPSAAIGVNGETLSGTLLFAASEGGSALPEDMILSGADGDTMTLYWTFYPEENVNYLPIFGAMTITFVMPAVPDDGSLANDTIWGDALNDVGTLSNGTSSSGTTVGDGISVETTDESDKTSGDTSTSGTNSDASGNASGIDSTSGGTTSTSTISGGTSGSGVSGSTSTTSKVSGSTSRTGSSISVGSGVSVSKSNPKTGDTVPVMTWSAVCLLALLVFLLDMKRRILYNEKR